MSTPLLRAAHELAAVHHRQYDPSHDLAHVQRVFALATQLAASLPLPSDVLVIQLAALFHDLLDAKYLLKGAAPLSAHERLADFWLVHGATVSDPRRRLVERVVENVSYSKEIKRIASGEHTAWHEACVELHWSVCERRPTRGSAKARGRVRGLGEVRAGSLICLRCHSVQDADKLDAVGAFGVLRCAAYSGATGVELYGASDATTAAAPSTGTKAKGTAVGHFHDKLFKLEGMMKVRS